MKTRPFRPMKAIAPPSEEEYQKLLNKKKSWMMTPKIDGIRCLIINGIPHSGQLKSIKNRKLSEKLKLAFSFCEHRFDVKKVTFDGELHIPGVRFNDITSIVMSHEHERYNEVKYSIFDAFFPERPRMKAAERYDWLYNTLVPSNELWKNNIEPLHTFTTNEGTNIEIILEEFLRAGYEGAMLRALDSPYKQGKSTWNEEYLIKLKPYEDAEATVIGFEELQHNSNPAGVSELGYTERSSAAEGKWGSELLGALVCQDVEGRIFKVGSGFTHKERKDIWINSREYRHKQVKFKFQKYGMKDKPRAPIFLGFRDEED